MFLNRFHTNQVALPLFGPPNISFLFVYVYFVYVHSRCLHKLSFCDSLLCELPSTPIEAFFFNRALSVFITTISVQKLFQFLKIYPLNVLIIEKYLHFAADFSFIIAFVKMKSRKLFNENPHRRKPGKLKWVLRQKDMGKGHTGTQAHSHFDNSIMADDD